MNKDDLKRLASLISYDADTGIFVWKFRGIEHFRTVNSFKCWNARYAGKVAGGVNQAVGMKNYIRISFENKFYKAHRIAWALVTGEWPVLDIDHINGDGTDNRFKNLRQVTRGQNGKNQRLFSSNASGRTGVCKMTGKDKWRAYIKADGRSITIGEFHNFDDACKSRLEAEIKFGFHPNHGTNRPL